MGQTYSDRSGATRKRVRRHVRRRCLGSTPALATRHLDLAGEAVAPDSFDTFCVFGANELQIGMDMVDVMGVHEHIPLWGGRHPRCQTPGVTVGGERGATGP